MRTAKLLPLLLLAACTDNASKQESIQIWAAAQTAMTSAQSKAVDQAQGRQVAPADEVVLDYSGPCSLGGTVDVEGSYSGDGSDEATFDLKTSFVGCHEITGTLDGSLEWTSASTATGFTATMKGGLDWKGNDGEASCDFDLTMSITESLISYAGHLCGYDVRTELALGGT